MGKLLNVNFELVSMEWKAKLMALSGKKIDVIFLHTQIDDSVLDELKNNSWIATKLYCKFKVGNFLIKK